MAEEAESKPDPEVGEENKEAAAEQEAPQSRKPRKRRHRRLTGPRKRRLLKQPPPKQRVRDGGAEDGVPGVFPRESPISSRPSTTRRYRLPIPMAA